MPISMLWVHTLFDLIVTLRTLQIFELEDELDSALDSHEHGVAPPMGRQRTMSTAQSRRPSGHEPRRSSGNGPRSPPPFPRQPPSPQKDGRRIINRKQDIQSSEPHQFSILSPLSERLPKRCFSPPKIRHILPFFTSLCKSRPSWVPKVMLFLIFERIYLY